MSHDQGLTRASIPTSYTRLFAQELGMHTRDLPQLLAETSLTVEQLLHDDTRLTAEQQVQIIENALKLASNPGYVLRLGRRLTPAAHGPLGYLASSSPTLLAAVEAIHAFVPTRMNFIRLNLNQDGDHLNLRCDFEIEMSADAQRFMVEVCAMTFFACAEFIIGRPAHEIETHLPYTDPKERDGVADHLPGRVVFCSDGFMVRIPMAACQIPNVSANHESYALAKAQCETILADLRGSPDSFRRQIETMMLSHPAGTLTEDDAAAALFISKRTLARRLKAEGVGFRQIREEILARQAKSFLHDGRLSVDAIATLLNYHDSANFRRAFKRWFGMSPDRYRQSAQD